jgi:hypothetical protein
MSLRNRARKLMKSTGLTYQQAIEKLRALGKAPADLRAQTGWTLEECDLHLLQKGKIGEASGASRGASEAAVPPRMPDSIEVVTVEPRTRAELACQQLLHTGGARAVLLVDGWKMLAHAGPQPILHHPIFLRQRDKPLPKTRTVFDLGDQLQRLVIPIKKLHLIVVYEEWTLLLEKRVEKCVDYLESLIEEDPLMAPPDSGESGPGGLNVVAWESVEIFRKKKS